jgi:hypothetical protein
MDIDELMSVWRREYWANLYAVCKPADGGPHLDADELEAFPSFYDWLVPAKMNRFQASAYGIGRDVG